MHFFQSIPEGIAAVAVHDWPVKLENATSLRGPVEKVDGKLVLLIFSALVVKTQFPAPMVVSKIRAPAGALFQSG